MDPQTPSDQQTPDEHSNAPAVTASVSSGAFGQVPIEITVSVGHARPLIRDLLNLSRDSILPLDRRIEDPVELYVGDRLIARGTLTEMKDDETGRLAVCLTEVADLVKGI